MRECPRLAGRPGLVHTRKGHVAGRVVVDDDAQPAVGQAATAAEVIAGVPGLRKIDSSYFLFRYKWVMDFISLSTMVKIAA